jgi:flagellar biosynthesis protein FlhG
VTDQAAALRNQSNNARPERVPQNLRCVAVGSGKGGVGKTMISIGLGYSLSRLGYRVLLLDADLGLANVDLQMGLEPVYTMQDVIYGNCSMDDAVVSVEKGPDVLAAASGAPEMADMGNARREMFVGQLMRFAAEYDFLLIDAGAGIGKGVTTFLAAAPEVLVIVANEPTSIMDAYSLIKVLRQQPKPPVIMLTINMVRSFEEGELLAARLNAITGKFLNTKLPVAGVVLDDDQVGDSIRRRQPLHVCAAGSVPVQCLRELARFLVSGESYHRAGGHLGKPFFDQLAGIGMQEAARE